MASVPPFCLSSMMYAPTSSPPSFVLSRGYVAGRGALTSVTEHPRKWEAYTLLGSGLASAIGILLYTRGYQNTVAAFGIFAAIGAATIGAVRILTSSPPAAR